MFTEPGVYQMVLNFGIFMLLFLNEYLFIGNKEQIKMLVVMIVALLTTQSTTGYLGLAVIFLFFFLKSDSQENKIRRRIGVSLLICIILLFGDFTIRGSSSLIGKTIMGKLFTEAGNFSLSANTGDARVGTIILCLQSMVFHPFGIGYEAVHLMLDGEKTGFLAAQIIQTGAALGVIPFLVILYWILSPIISSKWKKSIKLCYIFLYFNTALAQSREFYPALIFLPLFMQLYRYCQNDVVPSSQPQLTL